MTNHTDADGGSLTATLVTGPRHGTLTLSPDGSFIYTPQPAYTGTDTFTFRVSDETAGSHRHGLFGTPGP